MSRFVLAWWALLGALSLPACGTADIPLATYCSETGIAYCGRVQACGLSAPTCMAEFVAACCPGGVCPGSVETTHADACVSALATQSCVDVQAGTVPAVCR